MQLRTFIAIVLLLGVGGVTAAACDGGCSCGGKTAQRPVEPAPAPAEDPEAAEERAVAERRAELLRRADPSVVQEAPVISATEGPLDAPRGVPPEDIKPISKDRIRVGTLEVNLADNTVTAPGRVELTDGIVEFLAVTPKGKAYESVLVLDTSALHLRFALSMLGAEEAELPSGSNKPPSAPASPAAALRITARFERGGKTVAVPAASFLYDRAAKKPLGGHPWQLVAPPEDQRRHALGWDQLVATIYDPMAPIMITAVTGNPYEGPNVGLVANSKTVPPKGTEVALIFAPVEVAASKPPASPGAAIEAGTSGKGSAP